MADARFADLLLQKGLVTRDKIEWAKQEAQTTGLFLEEVLEKLGVSQAQILDTKSKVTGIPSKSLDGARVHFDVLKYVPEDSARTYKFAPLGVKEGVLEVGIIDPSDLDAREALQFIASRVNMPFRVYLISIPD